MGQALKNYFGTEIPRNIAQMISAVFPRFASDAFLRDVLNGYEKLELMSRGWQIAHSLRHHLPDDYVQVTEIFIASLGPKLEETEHLGMAPFLYLPYVLFVAEYGLDHFEPSMRIQYELTQRFSAEWSIRPYLEKYPDATLAYLKTWASDPSPHVRRLVSEGTRPRLPWATRLRVFQSNPRPVLALLEMLKDDPELYVRRSVANHLNDLGKDHPKLLIEIAQRWMKGATKERHWVIRHALRSAVKRAQTDALEVLGFGQPTKVSIRGVTITPYQIRMGETVTIAFEMINTDSQSQKVVVDLRVHFMKARGQTSPKVFKLKTLELIPHQAIALRKIISLAEMTTRKHYAGTHEVEVILNGQANALGRFHLVKTNHSIGNQ